MVRLTTEYIARCNGHTKRKRDEPTNHFLKRITHLYMAERNIEAIDNLSLCRNLTVLYLYDNKLNRTMNLGTAPNLTHLYLQNNNISKIEGLKYLQRLTKLYLGYNSLSVIEGLQSLEHLKELHVEYQRLAPGEKLLFDPRTLIPLSRSLSVINVSGNRIDSLNELLPLKNLTQLLIFDNEINEFESIRLALSSWRFLTRLDVTGNPVCHKAKYRDKIIVMSQSLEMLDGKEISRLERQFLVSWKASREARRRQRMDSQKNGYNDEMDLPPLHQRHIAPTPPPHYMMGGLPGGRKRFEAILAKSRSLPNSAMAPIKLGVGRSRRAPYTTPAPPVNSTLMEHESELLAQHELMGPKSVSDLTDKRRMERQMTPHPNTIRTANARPAQPANGITPKAPMTSPVNTSRVNGHDLMGSGDIQDAENGKSHGISPYRGVSKSNFELDSNGHVGNQRSSHPSLRGSRKTPFKPAFNGAILSDSMLAGKGSDEIAGDASSELAIVANGRPRNGEKLADLTNGTE